MPDTHSNHGEHLPEKPRSPGGEEQREKEGVGQWVQRQFLKHALPWMPGGMMAFPDMVEEEEEPEEKKVSPPITEAELPLFQRYADAITKVPGDDVVTALYQASKPLLQNEMLPLMKVDTDIGNRRYLDVIEGLVAAGCVLRKEVSLTPPRKTQALELDPSFRKVLPRLLEHRKQEKPKLSLGDKQHERLNEMADKLEHAIKYARLIEEMGQVDRVRLTAERERYGAKGANLLALKRVLSVLQKLEANIRVPEFELLSVDLFREWKQKKDIKAHLRPVYEHMKGSDFLVRSSAVHSEDGEEITGAGIYDSIDVKASGTFEEFYAAVERVYASVDAAKAVSYRKENNVTQEEFMGVVIQKKIDVSESKKTGKGYINSQRPYGPGLMEIVFEEQNVRHIAYKDRVEVEIKKDGNIGKDFSKNCLYYQVDDKRKHTDASLASLANLSLLLEQHYGRPVQIEFLEGSQEINVVQVRVLPSKLQKTADVQFPSNLETLHESPAIGVGDKVLNVLPTNGENNNKEGVVIFHKSFYGSNLNLEPHLPKSGAVIVLSPSRRYGGHIETLCAEKGILCLFMHAELPAEGEAEPGTRAFHRMHRRALGTYVDDLTVYGDFDGHQKIRVVSDGLRGKVYAVDEKPKRYHDVQSVIRLAQELQHDLDDEDIKEELKQALPEVRAQEGVSDDDLTIEVALSIVGGNIRDDRQEFLEIHAMENRPTSPIPGTPSETTDAKYVRLRKLIEKRFGHPRKVRQDEKYREFDEEENRKTEKYIAKLTKLLLELGVMGRGPNEPERWSRKGRTTEQLLADKDIQVAQAVLDLQQYRQVLLTRNAARFAFLRDGAKFPTLSVEDMRAVLKSPDKCATYGFVLTGIEDDVTRFVNMREEVERRQNNISGLIGELGALSKRDPERALREARALSDLDISMNITEAMIQLDHRKNPAEAIRVLEDALKIIDRERLGPLYEKTQQNIMGTLVRALQAAGQSDRALSMGYAAVAAARNIGKPVRREAALQRAYFNVTQLHVSAGNHEKVIDTLKERLQAARAIEANDDMRIFNVVQTYYAMVDQYLSKGDLQSAAATQDECITTIPLLTTNPYLREMNIQLAYNHFVHRCLETKDGKRALELAERRLQAARKMPQRSKKMRQLNEQIALAQVFQAQMFLQQWENALVTAQNSLDQARLISGNPGRRFRSIHTAFSRLINAHIANGNVQEAISVAKKKLEEAKHRDSGVGDAVHFKALHSAHYNLATALLHAGDLKEARKVLDDFRRLPEGTTNPGWHHLESAYALMDSEKPPIETQRRVQLFVEKYPENPTAWKLVCAFAARRQANNAWPFKLLEEAKASGHITKQQFDELNTLCRRWISHYQQHPGHAAAIILERPEEYAENEAPLDTPDERSENPQDAMSALRHATVDEAMKLIDAEGKKGVNDRDYEDVLKKIRNMLGKQGEDGKEIFGAAEIEQMVRRGMFGDEIVRVAAEERTALEGLVQEDVGKIVERLREDPNVIFRLGNVDILAKIAVELEVTVSDGTNIGKTQKEIMVKLKK